MFRVLSKECLLFLKKRIKSHFRVYPHALYTHRGGCMMNGYEIGVYEWSSMSLRYPLIYINCVVILV